MLVNRGDENVEQLVGIFALISDLAIEIGRPCIILTYLRYVSCSSKMKVLEGELLLNGVCSPKQAVPCLGCF